MALDIVLTLIGLIVTIIVNIIVVAPSLWIAGRLLAGKEKAKFTDALWIVTLGTVVWYLFSVFVAGFISGLTAILLAYLILLLIWLALVKHFFDCGWLRALAISIIAIIIAVIIFFVIAFIFVLIGIGIGWIPLPQQLMPV
jgi:hypothetical protein